MSRPELGHLLFWEDPGGFAEAASWFLPGLGPELRQVLEKMNTDFRDNAPLDAAGAATIILDGVRSGAWRILVGQDAESLDGFVRAEPEAAYDYALLASLAANADRTG